MLRGSEQTEKPRSPRGPFDSLRFDGYSLDLLGTGAFVRLTR